MYTQKEQLIAMLEGANTPFHVTAGTNVCIGGQTFVFHVNENLKDVVFGDDDDAY